METSLVTIAIPTFNRADRYLKEALECALNQTYENIEILVSDNCSTDNTPEIIQSYNNSKLKYYRQNKNIGKNINSNFLLEQAKGDYFLMLHDDDRIDHDFIETCIQAIDGKKDVGVVLTGSRVIGEDGEIKRQIRNNIHISDLSDIILSWYQGNKSIYLCSTLYNTYILREVGGFEKKYNGYDDVAAHFKCTDRAGRVDVEAIKASFRKHPESYTNTADMVAWCNDAYAILDLAYSLAPEKAEEIEKIGLRKSAKNMYRFANSADSRYEKLVAFWKVYSYFKYKYLPPYKYCNQTIPFSGFLLHPVHALKLLKSKLSI